MSDAALDPTKPFALLWDEASGVARLFRDFRGWIAATDLPSALPPMRAALATGEWLAGGFSYEAGHLTEPRLASLAHGPGIVRMGRFGPPEQLDTRAFAALLQPFAASAPTNPPCPLVTREEWLSAVSRAKHYIAAGDIYQTNLTFPAEISFRGHPLSLFRRLFRPEIAPHGGVVHLGDGQWWLSLSPELCFRLENGRITGRPMKGTAARMPALNEDNEAATGLSADPKNRAENLMITDLIRNDLARISQPGSVKVPRLFEIETYPSIHQMTSTVEAALTPGLDALDALSAIFPCGSITGAPKIRAMQIIAELEPNPRGIYCGSIGWIEPGAQAAHFNVAIRTLEIKGQTARLGLGAGIVADSDPESEWAECLAKAGFLQSTAPNTLIETMGLNNGQIIRLPRHLDRLQASAQRFDFSFDRTATEARLARLSGTGRLRLLLSREGAIVLQLSPPPPSLPDAIEVAISPLPLPANDWRLFHKAGNRDFHDVARRHSGAFETLYERPDGLLTEGSFTNLFVERDGKLLTPAAHLGLLPGVLRAELLENGMAYEAELRREDLSHGFFLGNSLRGLIPARLRPL